MSLRATSLVNLLSVSMLKNACVVAARVYTKLGMCNKQLARARGNLDKLNAN